MDQDVREVAHGVATHDGGEDPQQPEAHDATQGGRLSMLPNHLGRSIAVLLLEVSVGGPLSAGTAEALHQAHHGHGLDGQQHAREHVEIRGAQPGAAVLTRLEGAHAEHDQTGGQEDARGGGVEIGAELHQRLGQAREAAFVVGQERAVDAEGERADVERDHLHDEADARRRGQHETQHHDLGQVAREPRHGAGHEAIPARTLADALDGYDHRLARTEDDEQTPDGQERSEELDRADAEVMQPLGHADENETEDEGLHPTAA